MFVSKKLKFYCSLKYGMDYGEWTIKQDFLPLSLNTMLYTEFIKDGDFAFWDENVDEAVMMVYQYVCSWTRKESEYRLSRKKVIPSIA